MSTFDTKSGFRLYYEEHGKGQPVVLLGGIMMSAASWAQYVPVLERHMHLILLDLRDQGLSSKAETPYRVDDHVSDTVELLDHLGLETAHLIGLSYGGQVAQRVALLHGERVRTLTLANASNRISNHLAEIGRAWEVAADLNDGERFFQLAIPFIYSGTFYEQHLETLQERQAMFKSLLTQSWFEGFVRLCRSTEGFAVSEEELGAITMPTLLIGAEDDIITPVAQMERMRCAIQNCEFVVFPKAGHGAFLERAGEFLTTIIGFVAKYAQATRDGD